MFIYKSWYDVDFLILDLWNKKKLILDDVEIY